MLYRLLYLWESALISKDPVEKVLQAMKTVFFASQRSCIQQKMDNAFAKIVYCTKDDEK